MISFYQFFIYFFKRQRQRKRQKERDPICWFNPQMPLRPKPGARRRIQISCLGGKKLPGVLNNHLVSLSIGISRNLEQAVREVGIPSSIWWLHQKHAPTSLFKNYDNKYKQITWGAGYWTMIQIRHFELLLSGTGEWFIIVNFIIIHDWNNFYLQGNFTHTQNMVSKSLWHFSPLLKNMKPTIYTHYIYLYKICVQKALLFI